MPRIPPIDRDDLAQHAERFELTERFMGFVPNSMPTMARVPGLLETFQALASNVFMNELIDPALTQMVAQVTSSAAGCRYCQAHTAHSAHRLGVPEDKLADLWQFETSDQFSDAERAALRLAFHAGQAPSAVSDGDIEACRTHYSDDKIAAIVATISLFGFLNRWNDTMATELEASPTDFGSRVLGAAGWEPGAHAAGGSAEAQRSGAET